METRRIGITWQLSDGHGWGVFGTNLVLNLLKNGPCPPLLFSEPMFIENAGHLTQALRPYIADHHEQFLSAVDSSGPTMFNDATILHSVGNQFITNRVSDNVHGRRNIGFIFLELAGFDNAGLKRARQWDRILAGSSWNRDVCRAAGLNDVRFVSQGVDTELFSPGPRLGVPSGRFVVFSGGKLEYRKGQDLVVAAFKQFLERHPDSLLVTAWQNSWHETALTIMQSPYISSAPILDPGGLIRITDWVTANGIPADNFVDLGWVANSRLPAILREINVALFPNRCEGGTNLAAMEAMATGTPCILSANTGHLDLIDEDNCYALSRQTEGSDEPDHWRTSDIDEIVEKLELAYTDHEDRKRRARTGVQFMKKLSWENQTRLLIEEIEDLL